MPSRRRATERGFSLVEVLVASTILIVGLVSLAQLLAVAIASNISSGHTTYAAVLAAQKIEELRHVAWASEASTGVDDVGPYTRRWSIEPLPDTPADVPASAAVIHVSVTHGAGGPATEARVVTVVTRKAP